MTSDVSGAAPSRYATYCGYLFYFILAALPLSFAIADILMDLADYQTYRVRREFTGYSQVILIALLLWGCLKSWRVFSPLVLSLMAVPLLVLLGHLVFSPHDEIGRTLWRWTLIWLFGLVFYGAVAGGRIAVSTRGVVTALVGGAMAYTLFAIVFHFGLGHLNALNTNDLLGFGNVRASTRIFVPALMCAVIMFVIPSDRWRERAFFLSAAFIITLLSGYTGSRSTIMALLSISILAALLSLTYRYFRIVIAMAIVIAVGIYLAPFLPLIADRIVTVDEAAMPEFLRPYRSGDSLRFAIWQQVIELGLTSPFFGWGGLDFEIDVPTGPSNAHNIIVQVFYEVGLVGLSAMAVLAILFLHRIWSIVRDVTASPYVVATALAASAIMADALVSPALWFQYSAFLFVVLVVMTLTTTRDARPAHATAPRSTEGSADAGAAGEAALR